MITVLGLGVLEERLLVVLEMEARQELEVRED
jgi:hypothetical protein